MQSVIKFLIQYQNAYVLLMQIIFIWTAIERIRHANRDLKFLNEILSKELHQHNQSKRRVHYAMRTVHFSTLYCIVCLGCALDAFFQSNNAMLMTLVITIMNVLDWDRYWRLRYDPKLD